MVVIRWRHNLVFFPNALALPHFKVYSKIVIVVDIKALESCFLFYLFNFLQPIVCCLNGQYGHNALVAPEVGPDSGPALLWQEET